MSKPDHDLEFFVLLDRVVGFWSESINVAQIRMDGVRTDLYVISGLGDMTDSIAERLASEIDAVLVVSFCDALASTIRSAALFCTEIRPALSRLSTARENFEQRLHRATTNPDLGWSEDDISVANRYFSVNTPQHTALLQR